MSGMDTPARRSCRSSLTRRDFFRVSGAGALAATAAAGSASALSAQAPAGPTTSSAADAVGVGFIGVGIRGEILMRTTMAIQGTRIVAAADAYDGHFDRIKELAGPSVSTGRDYRRVLDNPDVQAVVIAVPDHWHVPMALDAMAAGKDVYIEKPMTHRWEEGASLITAARAKKRILQVGSQWDSMPANAQAIEIIKSGKLGKITLIDGRIHRNTPTGAWYYPVPPDASPETIDWDRFIGKATKVPFDAARFFQWRLYWDYSGGLPTDLFVHLITGTHTVMGVNDMPARVIGSGGIFNYPKREVPDQMTAIVEYPNQFTLTLTSTADNGHNFPPLLIMGTEGSLEYYGTRLVYHSEPILENYTVLDEPLLESRQGEVRRAARRRSREHAPACDLVDEAAGAAGNPDARHRIDAAPPREVLRECTHPDRTDRERRCRPPLRDRRAHGQRELSRTEAGDVERVETDSGAELRQRDILEIGSWRLGVDARARQCDG